jgi:hypothetical protein
MITAADIESITAATETPYVATVQYMKRPYAFFTAEVATPKAKDAIAPGSIAGNFRHGAVTVDGVDPDGRSVRLVWPSGEKLLIEMSDPRHKRCYLLALACLEVARQVRRAIGEYS